MKKGKIAIVICLIIAIVTAVILVTNQSSQVKAISSEKQLLRVKEGGNRESEFLDNLKEIAVYQASKLFDTNTVSRRRNKYVDYVSYSVNDNLVVDTMAEGSATKSITNAVSESNQTSKDYSTTNIQVENVDEADINKTDGDYIYSISDYQVVITDVRNPSEVKVASKLNLNNNLIPEDIILYNNKLVVIYEKTSSTGSSRYSSTSSETIVKTYDISSREMPKEIKSYELNQSYYTSRCIGNKLFVIASGRLSTYTDDDTDEEKVDRRYKEDGETKTIPLKDIKYLKEAETDILTVITTENLDNPEEKIQVSPFLMNISNAYVSENNIYLLNQKRGKAAEKSKFLKKLFGKDGIFEFYNYLDTYESSNRNQYTDIYKFNIKNDGKVNFKTKAQVDGQAINQYSMDEKDGHFRIATYEFSKGAKVTVYDENLKELGHSERVGANEKMYSTRFMGDKVYLVTYQTVDPLFVIDLSDERKPKVLGELSIPGYSTYLHPYDENHIIGIGMETKEIINKNASGKVTSKTARIVGMKMALFDVSDVRNPIQISQTIIGDSRTTSAILTNPKALLFSKEKELIAIPVNNYNKDFEVTSNDNNESMINSYKTSSKNYISEGYNVYKINLDSGFSYRGTITHENTSSEKNTYYSYGKSKMLRGLYIENNLFTISESKIKVNDIETLNQVSELDLKK